MRPRNTAPRPRTTIRIVAALLTATALTGCGGEATGPARDAGASAGFPRTIAVPGPAKSPYPPNRAASPRSPETSPKRSPS